MIERRPFLSGVAAAAALTAFGRSAFAAPAGDKMTVILDWLLNPNHAALFAAQHSGAFARAGLNVNLVAPSDPDSPPRLVAAGQADLAIGYGDQINMIAAAGLPVLRVATLIGAPLNTIMVLDDGRIRTLSDLKGKRIGISVGGVEEVILNTMLGSAGVRRGDFTVIKVNYDMVTALITHRLDAATGAYRNNEVIQVRQMGKKPLVFLPEQHGVPLYDELILLARRDRRGDPRLKRFLTALRQGAASLLADPDGTWKAFAAAHPELASPLVKASWTATMPAIARDPLKLDGPRYLAFQQFALAAGIIPKALPLDQFAVQIAV